MPATDAMLRTGFVSAVDGDPLKENRVGVTLVSDASQGSLVWARLLRAYSAPTLGSCSAPEVGDEVVLGLLNDDPADVIILGTLSGERFRASVSIKDQHGNAMTMDSSGVTISSEGDLTLASKGAIKIESEGPIAITAKGDVVTKGVNVTQEAQMAFTARGQATAELSASGQTTVKGAMVRIN